MQSQDIGALLEALAKAQAVMKGASKDSSNPFFKSQYADLTSVWDACREPLTKNGLSVVQTTQIIEGNLCLVSILGHSSGQWIQTVLPIQPAKSDIQSLGSAITYCRRYALSSLVGVCPHDDDAEAAMDRNKKPPEKVKIEFEIPAEIDEKMLHKFIAECVKNSQSSEDAVISKANKNPEAFLNAFRSWKDK